VDTRENTRRILGLHQGRAKHFSNVRYRSSQTPVVWICGARKVKQNNILRRKHGFQHRQTHCDLLNCAVLKIDMSLCSVHSPLHVSQSTTRIGRDLTFSGGNCIVRTKALPLKESRFVSVLNNSRMNNDILQRWHIAIRLSFDTIEGQKAHHFPSCHLSGKIKGNFVAVVIVEKTIPYISQARYFPCDDSK